MNTTHLTTVVRTVLLMIACLLAGCGGLSTPGTDSVETTAPPLLGTDWQVIELNGASVSTTGGQPAPQFTLMAQGSMLRGFSGCNRVMGTYSLSDNTLQFGRLATTRMACADSMMVESALLTALERCRRFEQQGAQLRLLGEHGDLLLVLQANVAAPESRAQ